MSLSTALQIATSGMNASQLGLSTVSHNVSNANTTGYHRQSVNYTSVSYTGIGNGVELQNIARESDAYLEKRLVIQKADAGYANTYLNTVEAIETQLGNPTSNSGLDKLMTSLFTQVSSLANYPDSSSEKESVLQQAQLVVDNITNTYNTLTDAQAQADQDIDDAIKTINVILTNIHELNTEISAQTTGSVVGANANDLMDERQAEIQKLAEYFPIQVTSTDTGAVRVITENGRQLIDVATYSQIERYPDSPYDGLGVRRILADGAPANSLLQINMDTTETGAIKALTELRDNLIPDMIAEVNELTTTFKNTFNQIHSQGTTFPPPNSLTSGNNSTISNAAGDLYTELSPALANASFNVSVVDSTGDTIATTLNTGLPITGSGPITLPAGGPFTMNDLVDLINNNADIGVTTLGAGQGITATVTTDANGDTALNIAATDSDLRIVISNVSGDFAGIMGMNNFFTGDDASNLAIRSDIASDSSRIATAQMRASDGGVSSLDNRNALALAGLANTNVSFGAAGGLSASTDTITGYINDIFSNYAVIVEDATDRSEFANQMLYEMEEQNASLVGVNVDEELTNMIIFQNAFQASARIISTIDELMDYLMQTMG